MWIEGADTSRKVFVVAEIGNNHEGSASLAKEMIDLAADAGVNAVKFQAFLPEYLSGGNEARSIALSKFHLTIDELHDLAQFAREKKVVFFSTPFDLKTADFNLCLKSRRVKMFLSHSLNRLRNLISQ